MPSTPWASLLTPCQGAGLGGRGRWAEGAQDPHVSICGGERGLLLSAGGSKGPGPILRGAQAGWGLTHERDSMRPGRATGCMMVKHQIPPP